MKKQHLFAILLAFVLCTTSWMFISCQTAKNITKAADKEAGKTLGPAYKQNKAELKKYNAKLKKSYDALANIYNAFGTVSIEKERDLGETVALQAYASPGFGIPLKDKTLMLYVNAMGNFIGQQSDRPRIPYHVAIVKSKQVNAFAAPGGYVFITSGLFLAADSESELASVIGHEIAHIARKHALCAMKRAQAAKGMIDLMKTVSGKRLPPEFEKLVQKMTTYVTGHNFDQTMELQADTLGMRYVLNCNYDPRAFETFLYKLKKIGEARGKEGGALASHPSIQARIDNVKVLLDSLKDEKDEEKRLSDEDLKMIKSNEKARNVRFQKMKKLVEQLSK